MKVNWKDRILLEKERKIQVQQMKPEDLINLVENNKYPNLPDYRKYYNKEGVKERIKLNHKIWWQKNKEKVKEHRKLMKVLKWEKLKGKKNAGSVIEKKANL